MDRILLEDQTTRELNQSMQNDYNEVKNQLAIEREEKAEMVQKLMKFEPAMAELEKQIALLREENTKLAAEGKFAESVQRSNQELAEKVLKLEKEREQITALSNRNSLNNRDSAVLEGRASNVREEGAEDPEKTELKQETNSLSLELKRKSNQVNELKQINHDVKIKLEESLRKVKELETKLAETRTIGERNLKSMAEEMYMKDEAKMQANLISGQLHEKAALLAKAEAELSALVKEKESLMEQVKREKAERVKAAEATEKYKQNAQELEA